MTAGVADLRKGVVLLEDRDRRPRPAALGVAPIRRLDALVAAFHREPGAFEELGDPDRASRSSYASSGFAWIARESAKSASRRSSMALIARWARAFGSLTSTDLDARR